MVIWRRLEAQIQRFTLDLVQQKGMVGATWTTVWQTVRTGGVVQHDGLAEPAGTPLNDARHVAARPRFRLAEEEQRVPAGAFVMIRCRLVPMPKFFNAQMGGNRYGFDPDSLAQFRMRRLILRSGVAS